MTNDTKSSHLKITSKIAYDGSVDIFLNGEYKRNYPSPWTDGEAVLDFWISLENEKKFV